MRVIIGINITDYLCNPKSYRQPRPDNFVGRYRHIRAWKTYIPCSARVSCLIRSSTATSNSVLAAADRHFQANVRNWLAGGGSARDVFGDGNVFILWDTGENVLVFKFCLGRPRVIFHTIMNGLFQFHLSRNSLTNCSEDLPPVAPGAIPRKSLRVGRSLLGGNTSILCT